jgi:subtilisin family serine protease
MLVALALAVVATVAISPPALAAPVHETSSAGGTGLKPRSGEWWFTTWQILTKVWPLTQGAGVTVAVLDSGVQANVPQLSGVVVPGGDVTGSHTDGERDFNSIGDGHGTQMAVLIAGQGHGTGMVGIAPEAKIMPVVVNNSAADVTASPGNVAAGIMYAANHGAKVIDISQVYPSPSASGCDAEEQAAVSYALSRNIVIVSAEGGRNLIGDSPSEPASCFGVLSVGAIQHNRSLWSGDVREPYLTVVAPGAGLISSGRDGNIVTENGTRSAAALVAGTVALIRSRYPSMPWYQVVQRIIGTALPEDGKVPNESFGFGIERLSEVVNAAAFPVPASTPNPVYASYLAWLASPQGRALSRVAVSQRATPVAPGDHMPARWLIATIAGSVFVLAAAIALLVFDVNRRPRHRRPRPEEFGAPPPWLPEPSPMPRVLFEDDPLPEQPKPYRIPPYTPPNTPAYEPPATDSEFFFPSDLNP